MTPAHPQLTLLVPNKLQSFTLATAVEITVHVHPTEHREHHFPAIWSLKTALGVWFAAAEANAPAQAVFPSPTSLQLISISHISLLCCSPALPCAKLSSNPAPPAQPE